MSSPVELEVILPPMVDITDIVRLVGEPALGRARPYARNGSVHRIGWDPTKGLLTGTVQGAAAAPYHCRIDLVAQGSGRLIPVSSSCSCPVAFDCKHVAATLLSSNAVRLQREMATTRSAPDQDTLTAPPAERKPLAGWKSSLSTLVGPVAKPGRDTPGRLVAGGTGPQRMTTAMGLQFELRPVAPARRTRWAIPGPAAPAKAGTRGPSAGPYRLGVRPVTLNSKGNWVKGSLTWNTVSYQVNRLNLDPEQHRWFCQFAPLHRANGQVYFGQDNDWLYLDDFSSPLLWNLFDDAARLGIALVGTKKDAVISIGKHADVSMDATGEGDSSLRLAAVLLIDEQAYPPLDAGTIGNHGVYAYQVSPAAITLAPVSAGLSAEQRALLRQSAAVVIPAADVDEFMTEFYPRLRQAVSVRSPDDSIQFPKIQPPVLVLTAAYEPEHTLLLHWDWEYPQPGGALRLPLHAVPQAAGYRDAETEATVMALATAALRPAALQANAMLKGIDAAEFSERSLPKIEKLDGVRMDVLGDRPDYRELTDPPELTISTVETDQRDWFDLGVMVTIGGRKIPFDNIFRALAKGKTKLLLVDNSYLSLDQPIFARLHQLIEEARALQEWETGLRISRYQAGLWSDFEDLAEDTEQAQSWRAAVTGLLELDAVKPTPVPQSLLATLRPYQLDGFTWLAFLWKHQLGGVLADDMGLGKTLQTLALILHAKESAGQMPSGPNGAQPDGPPAAQPDGPPAAQPDGSPAVQHDAQLPFLVVAPTSVVPNWLLEAARFAPGLKTAGITDTQGKSGVPLSRTTAGTDVVITSYALFRLDFEAYQGQKWAGLILDEAQFVKNRTAKVHLCAKDLKVPFKLAITGTPMENNLMELWSLFAIVAPGLFPSARKFTETYQRPIERGEDQALLAQLRRRIRPLMMRRTKDAVAKDLPAKQEQVLEVELGPKHKKIYETFLQRERQKLLGLIEDMDKNRFIVFRSLTLLRMLSLDASLVDPKYASVPSAKLEALYEQLEDVLAEGHRALIFSQFTSFLKKAAQRLDEMGIPYCYLDGSTRRRAEVITKFKDGAAPVFLISLKAGGFGLNLTEADYVFLLDPWWNPATENQAVDRTHRIGQTRNVMVYRMIAKGTIEEKVMALKERKARLFDAVMDDDAMFSSALTADDIRGLLE
ncbi:DEAD/DEAH box helicase [Arthrobacter sp. H14-L1]|uniref:DEAD/DEAH box helicase n=1 Tax=Arthrobacter sp. H14-L1 TaxID=2996697 RepID=UPI00226F454D|nr:DEAD/DEAH box helicase [Arthrobacter sp. H14-L1]MCY0905890.1 DEAD/DEAH box helicase [Arthrobacter sp. H14-L1]